MDRYPKQEAVIIEANLDKNGRYLVPIDPSVRGRDVVATLRYYEPDQRLFDRRVNKLVDWFRQTGHLNNKSLVFESENNSAFCRDFSFQYDMNDCLDRNKKLVVFDGIISYEDIQIIMADVFKDQQELKQANVALLEYAVEQNQHFSFSYVIDNNNQFRDMDDKLMAEEMEKLQNDPSIWD